MAVELEFDLRIRMLGAVLLLAGVAITVQFFQTLPEAPLLYILPYVLPATLFAAGGVLLFGGVRHRLVP